MCGSFGGSDSTSTNFTKEYMVNICFPRSLYLKWDYLSIFLPILKGKGEDKNETFFFFCQHPIITDDAGLFCDALNGKSGVFTVSLLMKQ